MKRLLVALVTVAMLSIAAVAQADTADQAVPQFGNVFLIVGENTDYHQVTVKNSPYLIGTVKPESAWLTNYFATTHYSESNYVAMTSGQFTPCEQADGAISDCHQDVPNLFNQLDTTYGTTGWTSWMESMHSPCDVNSFGGDSTLNKYRAKHNPALVYDNVAGTWSGGVLTPSPECSTQDIAAGSTGPNNMDDFNNALGSGVSHFNYIVPNECEDAHDNCKPVGNPQLQFDNFLSREVPEILNSPAWGPTSVLIITYDEADTNSPNHADKFGNGGQVVNAIISPLANVGSYGNEWNHYSLLRTLQDGLGTSGLGYLGGAGSVSPISNIWKP